jgi:hypothetical protein
MSLASFSPIPNSLYVQDVSDTAAGIGAANIPDSARYAEGHVRLASLSETREGTAPTATKGTEWDVRETIYLRSRYEIVNFKAVEKTTTNASIDWTFWNRAPN